MLSPAELAEKKAILEKAINLLAEHFDVGQVFVQFQDENVTEAFEDGFGNHFARQMQVHLWREEVMSSDGVEFESDDDEDEDE